MPEPNIAILEDSPELREELLFFLQAQGFNAWATESAESFWKQLHKSAADIVIVDIGLPGEDGFSVVRFLKRLRGDYGLIVVTARGAAQERQRGLALGSDLYLVKPVNFADLQENIEALWRRICIGRDTPDLSPVQSVNTSNWRLTPMGLYDPAGKCLPLTPREHRLMEILYQRRNEVCSKALLHELVFGTSESFDHHRIDVIISRLRSKARKLEIPLDIRSIFGRGVVFLDKSPETGSTPRHTGAQSP
ncbi:response regulator transcription factor [Haliea atlantica]